MSVTQNNGNKINIWRGISTTLISVLLSFSIFMLTALRNDLGKMNDKIFHHLTNDEIHTLRNSVVTKAEFKMHLNFSERNYDRIILAIGKMESSLEERMEMYHRDEKKKR